MDNQDRRTLYCGNLSEDVTEELLYELLQQAGPLEGVRIPKDKEGNKRNFGFATFKHEISVPYVIALMRGVYLFGKPLRLELRTGAESDFNPYLEQLDKYKIKVRVPENVGRSQYNNFSPEAMRNSNNLQYSNNQYSDNHNRYRQPVYDNGLQTDMRSVQSSQISSVIHRSVVSPQNYQHLSDSHSYTNNNSPYGRSERSLHSPQPWQLQSQQNHRSNGKHNSDHSSITYAHQKSYSYPRARNRY